MSDRTPLLPPASSPCGSCPYRQDVPSGVWTADEYAKLPLYDLATWAQPPSVFCCHQQDGRLCAGWVGCHDMAESFGLRVAAARGLIDDQAVDSVLDYVTDVALFPTGEAAAEHGLREIEEPGREAARTIAKLHRRRALKGRPGVAVGSTLERTDEVAR